MKRLFNVLLFLLFTALLSAQSLSIEPNPIKEKLKELQELNNPTIAFKTGVKIKQLDSLVRVYTGADTIFAGYAAKNIYLYDSLNNSTVDDTYDRYGFGMPWELSSREEKYYDTNDNLVEWVLLDTWNATNNSFDERGRYALTYTNNQLTEALVSFWDATSQTWVFIEKEIISYNASGYRSEVLAQEYMNGQWEDKSKWEYFYDTNNLVSLINLYIMSYGSWNNYRKIEYTYNGNNELTQELTSKDFNSTWEYDYKTDITYFAWGKIIEDSDWEFSNWKVYSKLEQSIDALNNLNSETYYHLDGFTQVLLPEYSHDFIYNDNFPYAVLQTTLTEEESRHQLLSFTQQRSDGNGGPLEPYLSGTYYWTDLVSAISEPLFTSSSSHTVFPNPASNYLTIELENTLDPIFIELFNASGQQVISQELTGLTLSLGDLPTGFYSYLIRQDGKAYSGKVIVE